MGETRIMVASKLMAKYALNIIIGLAAFLLMRKFHFPNIFNAIFLYMIFINLWQVSFGIRVLLKDSIITICIIFLCDILFPGKFFSNVWDFNSCLFAGMLCFIGLILIKVRENTKTTPQDNVFSDRLSYYRSLGMTTSEIKLFRETMNKAQKDIKTWEQSTRKSAKLKAIDMRTEGIRAAKSLFQELVRTPKRLSMAGEFLNEHLDALNDLTTKYLTIDHHAIKSKETIKTLQNSTEVIEQLSLQIVQDYTDFVAEDIADMNADLNLTKTKIKKKESYKQPSTAEINDILQADIDGQGV